MSIYDDPRLSLPDDQAFDDQVKFSARGDGIKARVMGIESLRTRNGQAAKYTLWDFATGRQMVMFSGPSGAKDLWRQLLEKRPEVGDDVTIMLIDERSTANGTFKEFDVQVERQAQPPPVAAPAPVPQAPPPAPAYASVPQAPVAPPQAPPSPVAAPQAPPIPQVPPVAVQAPPAPVAPSQPVPAQAPAPAYEDEDAEDLFGR